MKANGEEEEKKGSRSTAGDLGTINDIFTKQITAVIQNLGHLFYLYPVCLCAFIYLESCKLSRTLMKDAIISLVMISGGNEHLTTGGLPNKSR